MKSASEKRCAPILTALASHHGDPGSILAGFTPGFSHVGIVLGDSACRRVFLGVLPFPPALAFERRSILGSHFMSCPGMMGTYGSQLESSSLGESDLTPLSHTYPPNLGVHSSSVESSVSGTRRDSTTTAGIDTTGAAVAERLAHSPPIKANRAQSTAGSPDFRKWESCRKMPLIGGFSRSIFISITYIALNTSMLRAVQISSLHSRQEHKKNLGPPPPPLPPQIEWRKQQILNFTNRKSWYLIDKQSMKKTRVDYISGSGTLSTENMSSTCLGRRKDYVICGAKEDCSAAREVNAAKRALHCCSAVRQVVSNAFPGVQSAAGGEVHFLGCDVHLINSEIIRDGEIAQRSKDEEGTGYGLHLFLSGRTGQMFKLMGLLPPIPEICQSSESSCSVTPICWGAEVAERLDCPPPTKTNRVLSPAGSLQDFSQVGIVPGDATGWQIFFLGSPISPTLTFRRCSILTSFNPHRLSRPR
ncbi:hypothetical protein PR048_002555 [Dryococelus australis]|uniref:Uncharacterized protein n=1 Tax=Dryococelus australis TaxID=614101 RepID=A0ABQ9IKL5_9NEOP|nr:hypothetical protein PR048_002555 [Dryococelus australis]